MAITDRIIANYSCENVNDAHTGGYTLTNSNSATFVTGKVSNGVDCDATNESGLIRANADAAAFQMGTTSRSVAFWVNMASIPTSATTASMVMMGGTSTSGDEGWHITAIGAGGSAQFRVGFNDGTTYYTALTAAGYVVSTWYHVAATWDRNGFMRIYVDGVQAAATSIAASSAVDVQSDDNFQIGGRYGTSSWFDGIIDEVLIYDGVMSGDIRAIHRNGTTGNSYATISAITRPFVSQEFIHEQESNTTNATAVVSDLVAGQVALAILATDGNVTGAAVADWDAAWTSIINGGTPTSPLTRMTGWHKTVTSTDVSTETQVAATWTNNEKAVLIVQLWDNCAGVNASGETDFATSASVYTEAGVTTTVDGCRILAGIGIDGGTTVSSVDPVVDFNEYQVTNSAGHVGLYLGSENQATAGATGTYEFTLSATTAAVAFTVAMEPVAGGVTVDAAATDGAKFSDTAANTLVKLAAALDGVTLTDAATVATVLASAAADGLSLSDVAAVVATYAVAGTDGAVLTDAATGIIALGAAAADGLTFADAAAASLVLYAAATDGLQMTDTAVFPTGAAYVAATVTIANAIAASVSLQNAISATVTIKPD